MVNDKEFLFLSLFSYLNFQNKDIGYPLYELFANDKHRKFSDDSFATLSPNCIDILLKYFEKEIKKWKIFCIDDRRYHSKSTNKSGFYGICFYNDISDYVIAYRGSEIYPIEDAYLDFIQTDLLFSIGKIPSQFIEGSDILNKILSIETIDKNNIHLTGHSLGGGIAQYVAVKAYINNKFIPKTKIFNAIGINRNGIFKVQDTLDLTKIYRTFPDEISIELENNIIFRNKLKTFLVQEFKKIEKFDSTKLNKIINEKNFYLRFLKFMELDKLKFKNSINKNFFLKKENMTKLFNVEILTKEFSAAYRLINKIKENKIFEDKIVNYGHSEDFTNTLFKHFGRSLITDKNFINNNTQKKTFFANFKFFNKSISSYHYEDTFFAFLNKSGYLSFELNYNFMAASVRKTFLRDELYDKNLLADYFSNVKITENNFEELRNYLIKGLKKYDEYLIYKKNIISEINSMDLKQFKVFFELLCLRIASPYRYLDIFDVVIYK